MEHPVGSMVNNDKEDDTQQDGGETTKVSIPMMSASIYVTDNIGGIKGCRLILHCVTHWGSTSIGAIVSPITKLNQKNGAHSRTSTRSWSLSLISCPS